LSNLCVLDAVFLSLKQEHKKPHFFSSNQPLGSEFHLTRTTVITRWEAMQMVMAAQLNRLIQRIATLQHLVTESCTTCLYQS
jgi:hypothetical protein